MLLGVTQDLERGFSGRHFFCQSLRNCFSDDKEALKMKHIFIHILHRVATSMVVWKSELSLMGSQPKINTLYNLGRKRPIMLSPSGASSKECTAEWSIRVLSASMRVRTHSRAKTTACVHVCVNMYTQVYVQRGPKNTAYAQNHVMFFTRCQLNLP